MRNRTVSDEEVIRHIVERINELWLSKHYEDIGEFISEHVVIAPPGSSERICGREAYIQSFRAYDQSASTHEFSPSDPEIDIFEDVAIASTPFFVEYEVKGKIIREKGRDVLIFSQSTGEWLVIWRTMQIEPAEKSAS